MIKYAKIVDAKAGFVDVVSGNPEAIYKSEIDPETGKEKTIYYKDLFQSWGFSEMEVEEKDGQWYLQGYAPVDIVTLADLTEFLYQEK